MSEVISASCNGSLFCIKQSVGCSAILASQ